MDQVDLKKILPTILCSFFNFHEIDVIQIQALLKH